MTVRVKSYNYGKNRRVNMSELNDFMKSHSDLISKINQNIMSQKLPVYKKIYLDLSALKDIRLGLLASLSDKTQLEYLKEHLVDWNYRPLRDFKCAYPDLPLKEEEYEKMLHDPNYNDRIFNFSPDTDLSYHFVDYLRGLIDGNSRGGYDGRIEVIINVYPLTINKQMKDFRACIQTSFDKTKEVKINLASKDPTTVKKSFWANTDLFFLDDFPRLATQGTTFFELLYQDVAMTSKQIYAALNIDPKILEKINNECGDWRKDTALLDRFENTELCLSWMCHFDFFPFIIPTGKSPETKKDK